MSGVLHPKLGSIHSVRAPKMEPGGPAPTGAIELDDEPTQTAIRPAGPAYANDGPETSRVVEPDVERDDKPEPITWVRSRHPRLQH